MNANCRRLKKNLTCRANLPLVLDLNTSKQGRPQNRSSKYSGDFASLPLITNNNIVIFFQKKKHRWLLEIKCTNETYYLQGPWHNLQRGSSWTVQPWVYSLSLLVPLCKTTFLHSAFSGKGLLISHHGVTRLLLPPLSNPYEVEHNWQKINMIKPRNAKTYFFSFHVLSLVQNQIL